MAGKNALDMLLEDHQRIRALFAKLEHVADEGEYQQLTLQLCKEVTQHDFVERNVLYPRVAHSVPNGAHLSSHGIKEHEKVEKILDAIAGGKDSYRSMMGQLKNTLHSHFDDEEKNIIPRVRETISSNELESVTQAVVKHKASAPKTMAEFNAWKQQTAGTL